ncbi:MAG TPA: acetyl-CoA hydrolase/transferase C-terminal domain-containing protein [Ilumatobacteraceae bacterium]|nr:acetyl-CoA hydrolase/transferase C-terminal domain-containing protein [Ilumatobacteraceae bacterium]
MIHEMSEAVAAIRSDDSLAVPLGPGVPGGFLHALGEREDFTHLEVFGALLPDLYQLFMRPGVHYRSGFFGPAERFLRDAGASVDFVPADFRRFEPILHHLTPRVMATAAAPPVDGWVSLSVHAGASVDELHRAGADPNRLLIVEVSPHFPRTFGLGEHEHRLRVDEIDFLVETDRQPLNLADAPPTSAEVAIAEHAMQYVHSGCTLQTGIGGIPSQVAKMIAESQLGDFGVHSEMFTTGLMHLHQAGKVTNNKGIFDRYSVTTFAAGVPELYEWLHENDAVWFLPVRIVNSPELIAKNRHMVTINGALAVDLSGQVVADTIGGAQFSGIGGHEDFVSGPGLSADGRSLICLPSSSTVNGQLITRILPKLPSGSVISTPRHQVDVVITEYGTAELAGKTIRERAMALASIGHPEMRDDLLAVAENWPAD